TLDRQKDLAAHGYHKRGWRDYPLDLTAYVRRLQHLRFASATGAADATDSAAAARSYFPPPDAAGGWRTLTDAANILARTGFEAAKLDDAFAFAQRTTKNGGLLVLRHGWLVYERYFGRGHREATANLASCGKSFASVAVGILMRERPELFPMGLEQKVFTPVYFPPEAFPLSDPRKARIKLGQLLAFTAGIRGNNPSWQHGQPVTIDPAGPDGWAAMVDAVALGREDIRYRDTDAGAATLWCAPGEGYSYASSSIHLASIILRHVTSRELQDYVGGHLAKPLGWGRWGWGYKQHPRVTHTPGAGGIVLRPADMLRFGYLLLREGRWGDRQLIPADYVRHATRPSPYNPHYEYSLQFDVNGRGHWPGVPGDAFWKSGSGGHVLYIVPSLDLVVWKLGGRDGQYSQTDTGLPVHPEAARAAAPRPDWKDTIEDETAKRETLKLVLAALRES
ncbi:MAG: serine hydrolase domain-containing protein, partial [Opitutaceae bacterium]